MLVHMKYRIRYYRDEIVPNQATSDTISPTAVATSDTIIHIKYRIVLTYLQP